MVEVTGIAEKIWLHMPNFHMAMGEHSTGLLSMEEQ